MTEPIVCAIMLTRDRPGMARRAVECFRAQTYERKMLLVYNSGESDEIECGCGPECFHVQISFPEIQTIGHLRNLANSFRTGYGHDQSDILMHWDDDDWSHPNRIAEQVALLQSSGADCVGYREMLFWRQAEREAWLYINPDPRYCLGTSLCYWRKTWERKRFPATSVGEDFQFCAGLKCVGVSSLRDTTIASAVGLEDPRMIARIHGGNTSTAYQREKMDAESRRPQPAWRRVPEWDQHCRAVMEGNCY